MLVRSARQQVIVRDLAAPGAPTESHAGKLGLMHTDSMGHDVASGASRVGIQGHCRYWRIYDCCRIDYVQVSSSKE